MVIVLFLLSFLQLTCSVEDPHLCNRTEISIMKDVNGQTVEIRRLIEECCPGYGLSESKCK
ncbi:hypothetical protein NPIL_674521, partial [Nephila pilipes]